MRISRRKGSGFTLIELLIVVAIIAILAAIAVPNFLAAQMRAKVSRARADMRNQLTAIESYHVDNNVYPCDGQTSDCSWSWVTSAHAMTTPIAYMSSIPFDPFVDQSKNGSRFYWFVRSNGYGFNYASQAGKEGFGPAGSSPVRARQQDHFPRRNVALFSAPRDIYRYGFISPGPDHLWEWDKGNGGDPDYQGDVLYYDATNGVVSDGDLYVYGPGNAYNPPSSWAR